MMTTITIDDDDEENEEENSDQDEEKEGEEPGFLTGCFFMIKKEVRVSGYRTVT